MFLFTRRCCLFYLFILIYFVRDVFSALSLFLARRSPACFKAMCRALFFILLCSMLGHISSIWLYLVQLMKEISSRIFPRFFLHWFYFVPNFTCFLHFLLLPCFFVFIQISIYFYPQGKLYMLMRIIAKFWKILFPDSDRQRKKNPENFQKNPFF